MRKVPLILPFLLALFVQLYGSLFIGPLRLIAFAPFLAIAFQRLSPMKSLWTGALIGLLVDLSSSSLRLGFFSLTYTLTSWIAYKQKSHFFEDKPLSLSLYTTFISCLASTLQLALLTMSFSRLPLDLPLVLSDLVAMPLIDGLYAFFWFTCPLQVYTQIRKKWASRHTSSNWSN